MIQYTLVAADTQDCRIDKTDAGTCPQQDFLNENAQRKQYFLLQFYKTVIGHQARKQVFQVFAYIFLVIMLEAAETAGVEQNENNHNLCIAHTVGLVTMSGFLIFNHIFFLSQRKFLAKIIGIQ